MRNLVTTVVLAVLLSSIASARSVVFWQDAFPTVASQPVSRGTLEKSLSGLEPVFVGADALRNPATLKDAELLVLPYGSAFPAEAWNTIHAYLRGGGNLIVLGGQPFRVPVQWSGGKYSAMSPQEAYAKELDFRNTYEVPMPQDAVKFAWRNGYSFWDTPTVRARHVFAVEGGVDGLGYMVDSKGTEVAAPVVVNRPATPMSGTDFVGTRIVLLDFDPEPGYWDSDDGVALIRQSAEYARRGATTFWVDVLFSTVKPGDPVQLTVRYRSPQQARTGSQQSGQAKVELLSGAKVMDNRMVPLRDGATDASMEFRRDLSPGFYTIRATYEEGGQPREFYQNGFWVEDERLLTSGPALGVQGDFLTRDGRPYFPVGTNYFSTEAAGWDFEGPRNAWIWERDFAEMEQHGVTFVRTGVWMPYRGVLDPLTNVVTERFARNLEAFLLSARRHNIIVNFTLFAFAPGGRVDPSATFAPNPYMDPAAIHAEQEYIVSIVDRFKNAPWICWDLINEPTFSNPRKVWRGNAPNGDWAEMAAWHNWLRKNYGTLPALAAAWSTTPEKLESFDAVPEPGDNDFGQSLYDRYGNPSRVRAVDFNLFAQEAFTGWERMMVDTIRATGSKQLINVGQDEGGVVDRVLNQFTASGGVAFTTNHTYWRDDALLWDSVAAKVPGMPNIVGETGYQPNWNPDGSWRYNEITGFPLLERKMALGFASGTSGALHWDWDREVDFGIKRSDGSAKTWQRMIQGIGEFAQKAAPLATGFEPPEVAIVLPQSLQLSVLSGEAIEAQQKAVRALYHYARADAYVVGEYQIERLGKPKLIILPSPMVFDQSAWLGILARVHEGAILLVSGPFQDDPHFHATARLSDIGINAERSLLSIREHQMKWPQGELQVTYSNEKTTFLNRAVLPDGASWLEKPVGKGRILFSPLPLELSDNLQAVGDVYRYALTLARVQPAYTTALKDTGMLVCPTRFADATLYVLTSESSQQEISFTDRKSGRRFAGTLAPGRAALLMIDKTGNVAASYNWEARSQ